MVFGRSKLPPKLRIENCGERGERRLRRDERPERVAAVDKIEEKRKPEDFIGHRNRGAMLARNGPSGRPPPTRLASPFGRGGCP